MTVQDVLELHRAGWSREEVLAMMQEQQVQQEQPQQEQQAQQAEQQAVQQASQQAEQQAVQQASQQAEQQAVQQVQESETVQLLREMLGMIRGNNINTMTGETRAVDAAEILAANDYGFDKGGKT